MGNKSYHGNLTLNMNYEYEVRVRHQCQTYMYTLQPIHLPYIHVFNLLLIVYLRKRNKPQNLNFDQ